MATIIKVGIKVSDLKPNEKGYADINVAINDEINQWNQNCSAWNVQTKEERDAKTPRGYIGNGRVVYTNDAGITKVEFQSETTNADFNKSRQEAPASASSDLPF
jgi:hypothetical protein